MRTLSGRFRTLDGPSALCLAEIVLTSTERLVETNGVQLRVIEAGERGAPVVVLAHGFPELAYSWRHQIPVLAEAGYHVLAPDQRGYGGSSRPEAVEDYDIHALTGDLVGLLDDVGAQQAVFIGHDWGAMVVWHTALLHPDRVRAVAGLSVPPIPRARSRPTERWRREVRRRLLHAALPRAGRGRRRDGRRRDGHHDAECSPGCSSGPASLPDWISADEFDHYVTEFSRTGFTGALNWYRNYDRNWESTPQLADATITVPALFVGGTADPVGPTMNPERAREVARRAVHREVDRGRRALGAAGAPRRRQPNSCWHSCVKWSGHDGQAAAVRGLHHTLSSGRPIPHHRTRIRP